MGEAVDGAVGHVETFGDLFEGEGGVDEVGVELSAAGAHVRGEGDAEKLCELGGGFDAVGVPVGADVAARDPFAQTRPIFSANLPAARS